MNALLPIIDDGPDLVFELVVVGVFLKEALNCTLVSFFKDGWMGPGGQKDKGNGFLSTWVSAAVIERAYSGTIQGFHQKKGDYQAYKDELKLIIDYWQVCIHPNSFKL